MSTLYYQYTGTVNSSTKVLCLLISLLPYPAPLEEKVLVIIITLTDLMGIM